MKATISIEISDETLCTLADKAKAMTAPEKEFLKKNIAVEVVAEIKKQAIEKLMPMVLAAMSK